MSTPDIAARSRRLPPALVVLGWAAAATLVALALGLVLGRWPFAFDPALVRGLRAWGGPDWLRRGAVHLTALGGGAVLTPVVVAVALLLLVRRLPLTAGAVALGALSGNGVVDLVKGEIARARPDIVPHLVQVSNYSFPSGHAANSAIVYLTLAVLGSQVVAKRPLRTALIAAAIVLVALIGASRVYLGVHWPSDVLAGWSFGTLWAIGWWWLLEHARLRIGGER